MTKLQIVKLGDIATLVETISGGVAPFRSIKLTMTNLIKNMQGVNYNLDYDRFAGHSLI